MILSSPTREIMTDTYDLEERKGARIDDLILVSDPSILSDIHWSDY